MRLLVLAALCAVAAGSSHIERVTATFVSPQAGATFWPGFQLLLKLAYSSGSYWSSIPVMDISVAGEVIYTTPGAVDSTIKTGTFAPELPAHLPTGMQQLKVCAHDGGSLAPDGSNCITQMIKLAPPVVTVSARSAFGGAAGADGAVIAGNANGLLLNMTFDFGDFVYYPLAEKLQLQLMHNITGRPDQPYVVPLLSLLGSFDFTEPLLPTYEWLISVGKQPTADDYYLRVVTDGGFSVLSNTFSIQGDTPRLYFRQPSQLTCRPEFVETSICLPGAPSTQLAGALMDIQLNATYSSTAPANATLHLMNTHPHVHEVTTLEDFDPTYASVLLPVWLPNQGHYFFRTYVDGYVVTSPPFVVLASPVALVKPARLQYFVAPLAVVDVEAEVTGVDPSDLNRVSAVLLDPHTDDVLLNMGELAMHADGRLRLSFTLPKSLHSGAVLLSLRSYVLVIGVQSSLLQTNLANPVLLNITRPQLQLSVSPWLENANAAEDSPLLPKTYETSFDSGASVLIRWHFSLHVSSAVKIAVTDPAGKAVMSKVIVPDDAVANLTQATSGQYVWHTPKSLGGQYVLLLTVPELPGVEGRREITVGHCAAVVGARSLSQLFSSISGMGVPLAITLQLLSSITAAAAVYSSSGRLPFPWLGSGWYCSNANTGFYSFWSEALLQLRLALLLVVPVLPARRLALHVLVRLSLLAGVAISLTAAAMPEPCFRLTPAEAYAIPLLYTFYIAAVSALETLISASDRAAVGPRLRARGCVSQPSSDGAMDSVLREVEQLRKKLRASGKGPLASASTSLLEDEHGAGGSGRSASAEATSAIDDLPLMWSDEDGDKARATGGSGSGGSGSTAAAASRLLAPVEPLRVRMTALALMLLFGFIAAWVPILARGAQQKQLLLGPRDSTAVALVTFIYLGLLPVAFAALIYPMMYTISMLRRRWLAIRQLDCRYELATLTSAPLPCDQLLHAQQLMLWCSERRAIVRSRQEELRVLQTLMGLFIATTLLLVVQQVVVLVTRSGSNDMLIVAIVSELLVLALAVLVYGARVNTRLTRHVGVLAATRVHQQFNWYFDGQIGEVDDVSEDTDGRLPLPSLALPSLSSGEGSADDDLLGSSASSKEMRLAGMLEEVQTHLERDYRAIRLFGIPLTQDVASSAATLLGSLAVSLVSKLQQ